MILLVSYSRPVKKRGTSPRRGENAGFRGEKEREGPVHMRDTFIITLRGGERHPAEKTKEKSGGARWARRRKGKQEG